MECVVINPFKDRSGPREVSRVVGETLVIGDEGRRARWIEQQLVRPITPSEVEDWPWGMTRGATLTAVAPPTLTKSRIVACVSVWDDRHALTRGAPRWVPYVDHVIVVDGPYRGMPLDRARTLGWQGAAKALGLPPERVRYLAPDPNGWVDQCAKRTAYLEAATPGDLLFIVDADELVTGAECLLEPMPTGLDVGWVRIEYPQLYCRRYRQPRLIRARPGLRYGGRHHWIWCGSSLVATHQYGGPGWWHDTIPLLIENRPDLRGIRPRGASHARTIQAAREGCAVALSASSDQQMLAREALRILQLTTYDPGNVVYRLHTALNSTTPHASIFGRHAGDNPFAAPMQYDVGPDIEVIRSAAREADLIHCHLSYHALQQIGPPEGTPVVIHHHGTMYRRAPQILDAKDAQWAGLRLVSNLELLQYGDDLHWLPNPVPVVRYQRLRADLRETPEPGVPFLVGHSPSKPELKGTASFLEACARLQGRGVPIEPVLLQGLPLAQAIAGKARCDAFFDSFWLGIQCSGLEAAAMGIPVLAGDIQVRDAYVARLGECPYTFVEDVGALEAALDRLYADHEWRTREAQRVRAYVEQYHDYAAVALRYLDLLDAAFGWRMALRVGGPGLANGARTHTLSPAGRV